MPIQKPPTSMAVAAMMHKRQQRPSVADHQRNSDGRGSKAAKHQRAFAADDDKADARRQRHAQRGQDQRRGTLQRVLQRKRGAEAAALDELEKLDRRLAQREQQQRKQKSGDTQRQQRDHDVFGAAANADGKIAPMGWRRSPLRAAVARYLPCSVSNSRTSHRGGAGARPRAANKLAAPAWRSDR